MPILTRSDDTQFVMQPYRESLVMKKKNLMTQEVKLLAESQGQFVRLFTKTSGHLEAVFSREPGYLLGESIWDFFNQPKDLIYCEEQIDSHSILLVVVQNGSVYLDTVLPTSALRSELMPLLTGDHNYYVYLYGEVPLSKEATNDDKQLVIPAEFVAAITQLDEPVFMDLPVKDHYKLLPLNVALKVGQLTSYTSVFVSLFVLALAGMAVWWMVQPRYDENIPMRPFAKKIVNPYQDYHDVTQLPDPNQQLVELANALDVTLTVPGWQVKSMHFDGQVFQFLMLEDGGNYEELERFAAQNHFLCKINAVGAELTQRVNLPMRQSANTIMPTEKVMALLMDEIDQLLTTQAVKFESRYLHGSSNEARMTIRFDHISPKMLTMIGAEFDGLPVTLMGVQTELTDGLLKGNIQLSVWGR